jgi:hypothetical protein
MRRTPPVVVHLRPDPRVQAVVAVLAALAALGLCAWAIDHDRAAVTLLLSLPLVAIWAWRQAAVLPRRLRWDGEAWWLSAPGADEETLVRLDVVIDLDHWLLLHASPGPRWLPLARHQQPATWGALRATLHAAPARAVDA